MAGKKRRKTIEQKMEEARLKLEKLEKLYEKENQEAILNFFDFGNDKEFLNKIKDNEINKNIELKEEIKNFIFNKLSLEVEENKKLLGDEEIYEESI